MDHNEVLQLGQIVSDFFKQMLALNTGMIVLIIGGVEKVFTTDRLFKSRLNLPLLIATVACFVASLIVSLLGLQSIAFNLITLLESKNPAEIVSGPIYYGSMVLFAVGILLLLVLAYRVTRASKPGPQPNAEKNQS